MVKKKFESGKEGRTFPYLVTAKDEFRIPAYILIEASSEEEAERKVISQMKSGKLRNLFGRRLKPPYRTRRVDWKFVDDFLEGIKERHKQLYLEGGFDEASQAIKSGSGWLISGSVPYEQIMSPARDVGDKQGNLFDVTIFRSLPELTPPRRIPGDGDGHGEGPKEVLK